jgi:hypothetical protein
MNYLLITILATLNAIAAFVAFKMSSVLGGNGFGGVIGVSSILIPVSILILYLESKVEQIVQAELNERKTEMFGK